MSLLSLDGSGDILAPIPSDVATTSSSPSKSGSWMDTLTGWISSAGNLFQAGSQVYVAADQRIKAIEALNDDKVSSPAQPVPTIDKGILKGMPSWITPVLAIAGVLALIITVRSLRGK